jgi:NDP-sugar pyrophosphorylase family protein
MSREVDMKALVLALGAGRGAQPWRETIPTPLLPVHGEPLLVHTLRWLKRSGIADIAVALHQQAEEIREAIGDEVDGTRPIWSREADPRGTAGAASQLAPFLDETFLVVYGNLLLDVDVADLADYHQARHALVTLGLVHTDDPASNNMVECDSSGGVVRFAVKPATWTSAQRTASAGIFIAEPAALDYIPDDRVFDWEDHLLPLLVAEEQPIYAQLVDGNIVDIGKASEYERVRATGLESDSTAS